MGAAQPATGPDLSHGIEAPALADGATLAGRVGDDPVLLSRRGEEYFAVSGACTHYGALLGDGLVDGDHVVCPLHHACFNLRTGEALTAPAFTALQRWQVDLENGRIFVRSAPEAAAPTKTWNGQAPQRIVIAGGGAAGFAAAEMLRRRGYQGALTMLSSEAAAPCDRPNLSKDYLAGTAPAEWMPLREMRFYRDNEIDLRLATQVVEIDGGRRRAFAASGEPFDYDFLLLATGSRPVRPQGFNHPRVHVLRTIADADAIIAAAAGARRVVIIGAGFIGLETAASLRARGLEVHVAALDRSPMQALLGPAVGHFLREVHERHGVHFHFGKSAHNFDGRRVHLSGGAKLDADFVLLGAGVRPNLELAASAGVKVSNGIDVDAFMRTSDPSIYAAGDIACFPDTASGWMIRIEHWVTAQRQGQTAAINMLGGRERFTAAPFFWSNHYEHTLHYVGHAPQWDSIEIDGAIKAGDFTARYSLNGRMLAAAAVGRPRESLKLQKEMDQVRAAQPDHAYLSPQP